MFTPKGSISGLATDSKGIMRGYGPDIAWSKDSAGNVLAVMKG